MAELAFKVDIDGNGFAKVSKLKGDFNKADEASQKFGKALQGGVKIAGAFAVAAGGAALAIGVIVKQTLDQIDATTKASRAVGIQTELYTGLIHVAKLGGIEQEKLNGALKRFARNMNDAEKGIGTGKVAFEQLGVSIKDNEGNLKNQEDLMLDIADRFSEMENGAQKTAIAQDIFGKSGADMINVLNGGSEAMIEQLKSAEALGVVFDEELGQKAEYFNDRLEEISASLDGFKIRMTAAFADSKLFNAFINAFEMMSSTISDFISSEQFSEYLEFIFVNLNDLVNPIAAVIATFKGLGTVLFNLGQIIVDATIDPLVILVDAIAGVGLALGAFINGDFKEAGKIAGETMEGINGSITNLGANTVQNLKDMGDAFTGIEDDYFAMSDGMNSVFNNVNSGFDKMKTKQKEVSEAGAVVVDNDIKAMLKLAEMRTTLASEYRVLTTEEFQLLRDLENEDYELKKEAFVGAKEELEQLEAVHSAKILDIKAKEADAIADLEKKKQQAALDTFNVHAQIAQNTVATMQVMFGENKALSSAMVTIQGAQAVVNALTVTPFPLGLSMAVLAGAQTAKSLATINSTKAFALGGVVGGGEQMIRVNEQGSESVLNASATRSLGRETIDLLNNGRSDMLTQGGGGDTFVFNATGVVTNEVFDQFEAMTMERRGNR